MLNKFMIEMIILWNFLSFFRHIEVFSQKCIKVTLKKKRRKKRGFEIFISNVLPLKFIKFTKDRVDRVRLMQMIAHRERNLQNDVRVSMIIRRQM